MNQSIGVRLPRGYDLGGLFIYQREYAVDLLIDVGEKTIPVTFYRSESLSSLGRILCQWVRDMKMPVEYLHLGLLFWSMIHASCLSKHHTPRTLYATQRYAAVKESRRAGT